MAKADHIYVSHRAYTHHGIDIGDGTVVHRTRATGRVTRISFAEFAGNRVVHHFPTPVADDADTVVGRALSSVDTPGYCLVRGNCEHFATWCKTGRSHSSQVSRVHRQVAALSGRMVTTQFTKGAAKLTGKSLLKTVSPALLAVDAAQVGTEILLAQRGIAPDRVEQVGASIGLIGSAAVGTMIAGPIGAVVSVGLWAAGEVIGRRAVAALQTTGPSRSLCDRVLGVPLSQAASLCACGKCDFAPST